MTPQSSDEQPMPEGAAAGTEDGRRSEVNGILDIMRQQTERLVASGIREGHARGLAYLEVMIAHWPPDWRDELVVLIYGDFIEPPAALEFPDLGIRIEPELVPNTIIKSALCVLKARVKISERTVNALFDAAARIDMLLGALAALDWGNSGLGWWSMVTHRSSGGTRLRIDVDRVQKVVEALRKLPPPVEQKVLSALYWIREPRQLVMEGYRSDVLRVYVGVG